MEQDSDLEKAKKLYTYVTQNFNWNRFHGRVHDVTADELLVSKTGNGASINHFLTLLMKNAGLDAYTAIMSTKGNGRTSEYPILNKFNHSLAVVKIDGEYILLDAIYSTIPFGSLHKNLLAEKAFLLNKKDPRWIPIPISKKSSTTVAINTSLVDGQLKSILSLLTKDHLAYQERIKYLKAESTESYILNDILDSPDHISVDSFILQNGSEKFDQPLKLQAYIKDNESSFSEDMIYLSPFASFKSSNPFKSFTRVFPIDFYFPYRNRYSYTFNIPEGYEIVEMPESAHLIIDGKKAEYSYAISQLGNKIMISSVFKVNDPLFYPVEYPHLKELFDRMISKKEEVIVLKKKAE